MVRINKTLKHSDQLFLFLRTHLGSVRQKERRRQVAGDAAENVNDGDAEPASQLLQVPQYCHLEHHRHQTVQQAAGTCTEQKTKILLSGQPLVKTPHADPQLFEKQMEKVHMRLVLVLSLSESCEPTAHKFWPHVLIELLFIFLPQIERGSKAEPNWLRRAKQRCPNGSLRKK